MAFLRISQSLHGPFSSSKVSLLGARLTDPTCADQEHLSTIGQKEPIRFNHLFTVPVNKIKSGPLMCLCHLAQPVLLLRPSSTQSRASVTCGPANSATARFSACVARSSPRRGSARRSSPAPNTLVSHRKALKHSKEDSAQKESTKDTYRSTTNTIKTMFEGIFSDAHAWIHACWSRLAQSPLDPSPTK